MVGIYPRQSLFKKDSLSIDQQVEKCVSLCRLHGWDYKIYDKDKGYSGKDLNRPSFTEMMNDVMAGKIDKIICYKLDRISRNISDFSGLLIELQKYNCEFVSISENFDTSSPMGRAMLYICMVFAQMERETTSVRVTDNYYYRTELGFWGGGVAPYGYRLKKTIANGKRHTILEQNPETAKIVQDIYDWYLAPGGTVNTVLNKLNQELAIPSAKGVKWTSRVLIDVLTRPLYTVNDMAVYNYLQSIGAQISSPPELFDGLHSVDLYGKTNAGQSKHKRCRKASEMHCNVTSHSGIISSDKWISVQFKHASLLRTPSRAGTGKNSYFTGLMHCPACGRGISYTTSRGTQGYYICSTRKNVGWTSCPTPPAAKKKYDPIILDHILTHYTDPDVISFLHDYKSGKVTEQLSPQQYREKNELMQRMTIIDNEINNLVNAIAAGNSLTIEYLNKRIGLLDEEKKKLTNELYRLESSGQEENKKKKLILQIAEIVDDIPELLEDTSPERFDSIRDTCKLLVTMICFLQDGSVDVKFPV